MTRDLIQKTFYYVEGLVVRNFLSDPSSDVGVLYMP